MTKKKKVLLVVLGVILALMAAAYIAAALYFQKHFYSNTTVNGIDCTHLTANEVKELVSESVAAYQLRIQKSDGSEEVLRADQLQLSFADDREVDRLLGDQNPWLWVVEIFKAKSHELKVSVNLSDEVLAAAVDGLDFMQESGVTPPQDAFIQETDTGYEIVPETEGNQTDRDKVLTVLKEAVMSGETQVSLSESGCYVKPAVFQNDEALNARLNRLNQLVLADLSIDFGSGRTEKVDKTLLKTWITQDESGSDIIDPNKIAEYVHNLASRYNTVRISRTFSKTGGGTVTLNGGDYGWLMDTETTIADLTEAIAAGTQGEFEVTYENKAKSRAVNDIGDSYVEISIDRQTMWCYVDGKLLVSTPIVTGNVANGTETPRGGVWKVKGKTTDYTMKGKTDPATGKPSYTAHVNYWIPYSEDQTIGLHDLVTRSAYGGEIYKTNGSHGCVNTPLDAVKQIYDVVSFGFPVVVY